ncbi:MAG: hypothetical protein H6807_07610 [Planctomycetes bacterium]|nr:hypothetical protein [Planctomycetota bacterium]
MSDHSGQGGDTLERLLQMQFRDVGIPTLGDGHWIDVYTHLENGRAGVYSVLVPNNLVKESLSKPSWDLSIGMGGPGVITSYREGVSTVSYERSAGPYSPLVLVRSFYDVRPDDVEVIEEFRILFNLYHDRKSNTLSRVLPNGTLEPVVRLSRDRASFRRKELQQFLALRECHLALMFDEVVHSSIAFESVPESQRTCEFADSLTRWSFVVDRASFGEHKTFSRLLGKTVIAPPSLADCGTPFEEADGLRYEEFKIEFSGEIVRRSCDPDELNDLFNSRPGSPPYLTPVYFSKDVLDRYFDKAESEVRDGVVKFGSLWALHIDNDHDDKVIVFLGDLGKELPESEQAYWKAHNIEPDGTSISGTSYQRSICGEFADAKEPALVFRSYFGRFTAAWRKRQGWDLFLPPKEGDQHLLSSLRVPGPRDQRAFDFQVLGLATLLVDSLNKGELFSRAPGSEKEDGSLTTLELYLKSEGLGNASVIVRELRTIQSMRSACVGHRKGKTYEKLARKVGIGESEFDEVFRGFLASATGLLRSLASHFLLDLP